MNRIVPIQLDDGTVIYLEASENVDTTSANIKNLPVDEEILPTTTADYPTADREKIPTRKGSFSRPPISSFGMIEGTIRAYTNYTLNAFKQIDIANVDKVILEFGIKVGGEAGIPYITKGNAESNLKITVECCFPKKLR